MKILFFVWGEHFDERTWEAVPRIGETVIFSNPPKNFKVTEVLWDTHTPEGTARVHMEPLKSN